MTWRPVLCCRRLVLRGVLLIVPLWLPMASVVVWVLSRRVGVVITTTPIRAIVVEGWGVVVISMVVQIPVIPVSRVPMILPVVVIVVIRSLMIAIPVHIRSTTARPLSVVIVVWVIVRVMRTSIIPIGVFTIVVFISLPLSWVVVVSVPPSLIFPSSSTGVVMMRRRMMMMHLSRVVVWVTVKRVMV